MQAPATQILEGKRISRGDDSLNSSGIEVSREAPAKTPTGIDDFCDEVILEDEALPVDDNTMESLESDESTATSRAVCTSLNLSN
ncbi:hypothetical protein OSTOST_25186, partial [Ostertagia ostertagi]